jgi:hypothetical protein
MESSSPTDLSINEENTDTHTVDENLSIVPESEYSIDSFFDSQATQLPGLVWCWSEDWNGCQCTLHQAIRSNNWNPDFKLASVCHYSGGPVHHLYSHDNDCRAFDRIKRMLRRRLNGIHCEWWFCIEQLDDDELTDDSHIDDECEGDIP